MNFDIDTPEGLKNACAWQRQLCNLIAEGGTWVVPRSGSIYTFYRSRMTAVRTGLIPEPVIARVLAEIGWKVEEK